MPLPRKSRWLAGVAALAIACAATAVARAEDAAPARKPADPPPAAESPNAKCLACHADAQKAGGHLVDGATLARSAHKQECAECHSDFEAYPHTKQAKTVGCAECHDDVAKVVAKGAHSKPPKPGSGVPRTPVCVDCHGVHDVFKAKERESRLYPLNVPATCGQCHGGKPQGNGSIGHFQPTRFTDDTHGKGLLEAGLVLAPSCVTCHGGHATVP